MNNDDDFSYQGSVKRSSDELREYQDAKWNIEKMFCKAIATIVPSDDSAEAKHLCAIIRLAIHKLLKSSAEEYLADLKKQAIHDAESLLKSIG